MPSFTEEPLPSLLHSTVSSHRSDGSPCMFPFCPWLVCFSLWQWMVSLTCILFVLIKCWNVSKPVCSIVFFSVENIFQFLKYGLKSKSIILEHKWRWWLNLFYAVGRGLAILLMGALTLRTVILVVLLVIYCLRMSFPLRWTKYHIKCLPIFLKPWNISLWSILVYKEVSLTKSWIIWKRQTDRTLWTILLKN